MHARGIEVDEPRLIGPVLSLVKSSAAPRNTSSTVSMRFVVSGPVFSISVR